jgi:hypothetical protein
MIGKLSDAIKENMLRPLLGNRMFRTSSIHLYRKQRGAAAVEAAIVMILLVTLLTFPIFFARIYWHYTVVNKAAQDAARYLSTVSAQEMKSRVLATAAADVAREIVALEIAELYPGTEVAPPVILCGTDPCGIRVGIVPATVRVQVTVEMKDIFFGVADTGRWGWPLVANVTLPYVGT